MFLHDIHLMKDTGYQCEIMAASFNQVHESYSAVLFFFGLGHFPERLQLIVQTGEQLKQLFLTDISFIRLLDNSCKRNAHNLELKTNKSKRFYELHTTLMETSPTPILFQRDEQKPVDVLDILA